MGKTRTDSHFERIVLATLKEKEEGEIGSRRELAARIRDGLAQGGSSVDGRRPWTCSEV